MAQYDPDGRGCALAVMRLALGLLLAGVAVGFGIAWIIAQAL
jgi:hypothetical protein